MNYVYVFAFVLRPATTCCTCFFPSQKLFVLAIHQAIHNMSLEAFEESRASALKDTRKSGWSYLQFLEQQSISRPRDVVSIGKKLLENDWISSGNRWRLLERVVICSLELRDTTTARECIKKLQEKFTLDSNRVRVLTGMYYETKDDIKKAKEQYAFILDPKNDPNHMMAQKRRIALFIGERRINDAIKALCFYLKMYGSDHEAWKQLLSLYEDIHCYDLAKFCIEELITLNHNDYLLYQLYAETLYNMGGDKHLLDALKYFSQSLLLSSDKNTRSLWGIIMTVRAMKSGKLAVGKQEEEMIAQCAEKIVQNYADSKSKLMDTVKNVLLDLNQESA